jgi:hypothetical protein
MTHDYEIKPMEALSHHDARHNWSYYFALSKVDDFQLTIPNPSPVYDSQAPQN